MQLVSKICPLLGQNLRCCFGRCAEHPDNDAIIVANGGIGKCEPGLFIKTLAVHDEWHVFVKSGLSGHSGRHERRDIVPNFAPDILKLGAYCGRVLVTKQHRIGIVVEKS